MNKKSLYFILKLFLNSSLLANGFSTLAMSSVYIPSMLSNNDMQTILKNIGPSTAARILSSPYPLGGDEGLEIGLSRQEIDIGILSNFASETSQTKSQSNNIGVPIFSIGKGLYNDVDFFLSLIPFSQSTVVSHFSSQLRIKHWSSKTSPFNVSSIWNAGYTTLKNAINFQNYGYDIVGTFYFQEICLYFGIGTLFSNGRFIGGDEGITQSKNTEVVTTTHAHRLVGLDYRMSGYFLGLQMDSYEKSYFSIKLGFRF